jgi:ketosteroid isomerase-like protein
MSQENVDLVYRGFDALNRRDFDAAFADYDADVDLVPVLGPASTTYRGHAGARRCWDDLLAVWPDFSVEVLEARDLGDFVVGTVRTQGHGAGSDVETEQTFWYAARWRNQKLLSYRAYESQREALEAVGLRE